MSQQEYILILLNDCGFGTHHKQQAYMQLTLDGTVGRCAVDLDKLSSVAKSKLISDLLRIKEQQKEARTA